MKMQLQPKVLKWVRERARLGTAQLAKKIGVQEKRIKQWEETGELSEAAARRLAQRTYAPYGYLFLQQPLDERLPISDFRRVSQTSSRRPTPDLLDVLYQAKRRQNWYRDYLVGNFEEPLPFVGKATLQTPPVTVAKDIRNTIGIGPKLTASCQDWEDAMRCHIEATEQARILVLRSSVVEGNTRRPLSVDEFRGFALSDKYAPLIFINGADARSAQMFTLAHEVAHIWLGESGISNLERTYPPGNAIEKYCNSLAAEVLLPLEVIRSEWRQNAILENEVSRLSHKYKISRIVVARRARDAQFITEQTYVRFYEREMAFSAARKSGGGDYYLNEQLLNSRRFSAAIIQDAYEGRTLYQDAMNLLGIKKEDTFRKFAESLQITA
jgi:Zn-dependent peptidase ImmA (M78 family)/transcriptional regulator with XRE-family HTH domain